MSRDGLDALLAAFARGDLDAAAHGFAQDGTYREARRPPVHGRDAIARHFSAFAVHAVEWRFEVDDVIRDGERACVVYRFVTSGGAREPRRERAGCATVRLDGNGMIAEWREYEG